jgi:hypothetical protein
MAVFAGFALDDALARWPRLSAVALVAIAAVTVGTGILLAPPNETLTADDRELMAWASAETPADATFAVIGYPPDRGFVDWFPALSGRLNLTTWQGSEWVPRGSRRVLATGIAECRASRCLPQSDYYVLSPDCCPYLTQRMRLVHGGIFVRASE